jgi:hypothetical protein
VIVSYTSTTTGLEDLCEWPDCQEADEQVQQLSREVDRVVPCISTVIRPEDTKKIECTKPKTRLEYHNHSANLCRYEDCQLEQREEEDELVQQLSRDIDRDQSTLAYIKKKRGLTKKANEEVEPRPAEAHNSDWQLLPRIFYRFNMELGPFDKDAACDNQGCNALISSYWIEEDDLTQHNWEHQNILCNVPFHPAYEALHRFLTCKGNSPDDTSATFQIPAWTTSAA